MNMDIFEGRWYELKGTVKQVWSRLTDDDLMYISGSWDKLVGKLQEHYGYTREQAEAEAKERMSEAHH